MPKRRKKTKKKENLNFQTTLGSPGATRKRIAKTRQKKKNVFTLKEVNARRKKSGKQPWTRKRYNEAISTVKKSSR